MAGQQFQYDDSGNTFFYFLTSFVGLIVIPATYYLWPRDQNAGECCRQLPADQCRPRQPLWAAPPPPSPTQPPSVGVIQPASRPAELRVRGVRRWRGPGSAVFPSVPLGAPLHPRFIVFSGVSLRSLSPIVLGAPCSLLLPLCLLCL